MKKKFSGRSSEAFSDWTSVGQKVRKKNSMETSLWQMTTIQTVFISNLAWLNGLNSSDFSHLKLSIKVISADTISYSYQLIVYQTVWFKLVNGGNSLCQKFLLPLFTSYCSKPQRIPAKDTDIVDCHSRISTCDSHVEVLHQVVPTFWRILN